MNSRIREVCNKILERIVPSEEDRSRVESLTRQLERRIAETAEKFGVDATVRLEGSIAKDTWLKDDLDIDIFMMVPKTLPRHKLGDVCLKIAKEATKGSKQVERFAEHPYLEAFVESFTVNIVPCYHVKKGEWLSATDRTPFHTDYIKKHLKKNLRNEVRLLKKFMKGIDVYGAEIKIGGFSGYLAELLILHYGSFINVLKGFANFKKRLTIDIQNYYKGRENELSLLFKEPLIVVDPVDKGRNVASAVQREKLYSFVAASRAFLKNPSEKYFYPPETKPLTTEQLKKALKNRGSTLIFITFEFVEVVPDVLWGQLYRSIRSLQKLLTLNDFKVLRSSCWSDEKTFNVFLFELEQSRISIVKKHYGPPLEKSSECERFLRKHLGRSETVAGPYIEDGRWVVEVQRKFTDAPTLLREKLRGGGRNVGVAEKISEILKNKGFKVYVDLEILGLYNSNREFAKFLTEFLSGKPKWLETAYG